MAAIVVDVEGVDAHRLRRLRGNGEERAVVLARQQDGLSERAVRARRAAFNHQWAADAVEAVLHFREHAQVLVTRLQVVARIGNHLDGLGREPVARGEGDHRRPLGDAHRGRSTGCELGLVRHRGVDAGWVGDHQEIELLVAGHAVGDEVDLEGLQTEAVGAENLAFEEAAVQPARAVGARECAQHLVDAGIGGRQDTAGDGHGAPVGREAVDHVRGAAAVAERDGLADGKAVFDKAAVHAARDRCAGRRSRPGIQQEGFGGSVVLDRAGVNPALDELADLHAGVVGATG